MSIGEEIKAARRNRVFTQEELAKRVGISRNYIAQIETGRKIPSIAVLAEIAKATECDIGKLLRGDPLIGQIRTTYKARAIDVMRDLESEVERSS